MSTAGAPSALIADDEPGLRAELERLLSDTLPGLVIEASVGDGVAEIEAIERLRPDVAFLDIRMPPPSGLDVARTIGAETAVVFVTAAACGYPGRPRLVSAARWPRSRPRRPRPMPR